MQIKALIFAAAAVGQATATLDLLTGKPLSEAVFGLSPAQVKNVDNAIVRAEQLSTEAITNAYTITAKAIAKIITDIDKNSAPAFKEASAALTKALTPEVRQKVKKAITTIVDSTLNAIL